MLQNLKYPKLDSKNEVWKKLSEEFNKSPKSIHDHWSKIVNHVLAARANLRKKVPVLAEDFSNLEVVNLYYSDMYNLTMTDTY